MFQIIDKQTNLTAGTFKNRKTARNKADKLDNVYGGYRYYVKEVIGC